MTLVEIRIISFLTLLVLEVGICAGLNCNGKSAKVELPVIEAIASKHEEYGKTLIPETTTIHPKQGYKRHGKNIGNETDGQVPNLNVTTKILTLPDTGDDPLGQLTLVCRASYPVQWGFRLYQQWTPWSTSTRRIIANSSQEMFETSLNFPQLRSIVQIRDNYPTCYRSNDICTQTSVRVGFENSDRRKPQLKAAYGSEFDLNPESDFGQNLNCSLNLAYDPSSGSFYCQFKDSGFKKTNITLFPRTCANPVECSKVYQGQQENCSSAVPSVSLEGCKQRDGCVKLTYANNYLPSVAVCLVRGMPEELALESSVAIPFFYSVQPGDDGKPIRYISWDDIDPQKMLEFSGLLAPLFVGQPFSFHCNASYYYFSAGLRFNLKSLEPKNSSSDLFETLGTEELTISETTTGQKGQLIELPYLRTLKVSNYRIWTPGTYEFFCSAPVWNSTKWVAKSSGIIAILESQSPSFPLGNNTVTEYYKPEKELFCYAAGVPQPQIIWTLNEAPLPPQLKLAKGENDTGVWSSVKFPGNSRGIYGNFSCRAENWNGASEKTFIIIPTDKSSSIPLVVIAVMASLGLFLIPFVLFLVWKVRRQTKQLSYLTQDEVDEFLLGRPDYIPFQCDMSSYAYYLPYDNNFEIPRLDLEIDFSRVLGSGAYGMVVKGDYKNPITNQSIPVAIKTTKPLNSANHELDMFKALLSELKIMTYIGNNENIVNLIGACTANIQKKEVFIALEFCENGSLISFMRTNRHTFVNPGFIQEPSESTSIPNSKTVLVRQPSFLDNVPAVQYVRMEDLSHLAASAAADVENFPNDYANITRIGRNDLLRWAYEIAEGMAYLNSKKVIHGDLAARNILLTKGLVAKIGDFGLSKRLLHYSSYTKTANTPLPIKWLAIECLQDFQFSAESDIWSFGVVLWEVFSLGEIPYSGFNGSGEEFLMKLSRGMRLNKPQNCSQDIFDVMMKCWKHNRKERPKFNVLAKYFKKCLETPAHAVLGLRLSTMETELNELNLKH